MTLYCNNQTVDKRTLDPNCIIKYGNSGNSYCLHVPTNTEEFGWSVAPLLKVLPALEANFKTLWTSPGDASKTLADQVNIALAPAFEAIYSVYGLGPTTTTGKDMSKSLPCGQEFKAFAYEVLKQVLPLINPCIDVTDLPSSLMTNHMKECPNNKGVYVCATAKNPDTWQNQCASGKFLDAKTLILISVIVLLLIILIVFLTKK